MRQKLTLLLTFIILVSGAFAQKKKKHTEKSTVKKEIVKIPGVKKGTLFGISYNLSDFNAPKNFGANSNAKSTAFKDMSSGLSVAYWKGIRSKFDFSAKLNGIFHDYSSIYYGTPGKTELGLELEPSINYHPINDQNLWSPIFTAGVGVGLYTNHIGAYVPLGVGIQLNAGSTTYFFLQGQYKVSLTPKVVGDNMFYSIGFAENIGK